MPDIIRSLKKRTWSISCAGPIARRKFFEHKALDPRLPEHALTLIGKLYEIKTKAAIKKRNCHLRSGRSYAMKEERAHTCSAVRELMTNTGHPILPKNKLAEAMSIYLESLAAAYQLSSRRKIKA